jgi:hypothetical protein
VFAKNLYWSYSEPYWSSPHPSSQNHFNIILPSMQIILIGHFPTGFPTKLYMHFSSPTACCLPCHLIYHFNSICASYEAPHYAVFLKPLTISSLFGQNIFIFFTSSTPSFIQWLLGALSPGWSWPLPSSTEVKNTWIYSSTPHTSIWHSA